MNEEPPRGNATANSIIIIIIIIIIFIIIICIRHLRSLQNYGRLNKNQSKECKQKRYFDFDHDVPINQHCDQTFCDFHREHSQ